MENKYTCCPDPCFLCRTCLPEWGRAIDTHRKQIDFRKNAPVFREGEPVKGIYFVKKGVVKVHKVWNEEKELIIRLATVGDLVGHRGLSENRVYPVSATALTRLTVCVVDVEFFQASLRTNYPFMYKMLDLITDELEETEERLRHLAHMPVKGRVAYALLMLAATLGKTEDGPQAFILSRQDLASFAGTTYETVFRVLSEMVKERLVGLHGKEITILDPDRLKTLAGQRRLPTSAIPAQTSV